MAVLLVGVPEVKIKICEGGIPSVAQSLDILYDSRTGQISKFD